MSEQSEFDDAAFVTYPRDALLVVATFDSRLVFFDRSTLGLGVGARASTLGIRSRVGTPWKKLAYHDIAHFSLQELEKELKNTKNQESTACRGIRKTNSLQPY